mmetsp:Transcript_130446/g.237236  ORF Transcript_130446/g.237236 Transcript_130446/m.237236 type:complete len:302 (+) Transcript_130446:1566-2471(+)
MSPVGTTTFTPLISPHMSKMFLNPGRCPIMRAARSLSMKLASSVRIPKYCIILKAICAAGSCFAPGGRVNSLPPVAVRQISSWGGGALGSSSSGKLETLRIKPCFRLLTDRSNAVDFREVCRLKPYSKSRRGKSSALINSCIASKKLSSSTKPHGPPSLAFSKIEAAALSSNSRGQSSAIRRCPAANSAPLSTPSPSASHHLKTPSTARRSSSSSGSTSWSPCLGVDSATPLVEDTARASGSVASGRLIPELLPGREELPPLLTGRVEAAAAPPSFEEPMMLRPAVTADALLALAAPRPAP